jgi:hypothetical protein
MDCQVWQWILESGFPHIEVMAAQVPLHTHHSL